MLTSAEFEDLEAIKKLRKYLEEDETENEQKFEEINATQGAEVRFPL